MQQHLVIVLFEPLSKVVGEVMLDVVGELVPEVRVKFEDLEEFRDLDAFEEAVSQRPHIGTALHDRVVGGGDPGGPSVGHLLDGDVAPDQVPLTQQGHHHPLLDHLHGAAGEVEDVLNHVARVDQELVRGAE